MQAVGREFVGCDVVPDVAKCCTSHVPMPRGVSSSLGPLHSPVHFGHSDNPHRGCRQGPVAQDPGSPHRRPRKIRPTRQLKSDLATNQIMVNPLSMLPAGYACADKFSEWEAP